ncbi:proclotting enzyme-like isoform X2 [Macrobrachium nipponense]|uniref:proclotting enzyme-like isoform X2 n=1 Tax=Macrobrachium nipponense TaxID=159736 RepID=UPI0030C7DF07
MMKAPLMNCFSASLAFCLLVLCGPFVLPSVAQVAGIRFGHSRNVDRILHDSFGTAVSTRISNPSSESCTSLDQQQGRCVLMSECPVFIPLVGNIREPGVFSFIRDRICSLEVTNVRICCPNNPNNVALPTSVRLPSSGGFAQQETPSHITFGGSTSGGSSQALPVAPQQNLPLPSFPSQSPNNFPISTTNTAGSLPPTTQTQNPFLQGTGDQIAVSLPIHPQVPSNQNPLAPGTTLRPQNGDSFSPNSLLPDRTNDDQSQDSGTGSDIPPEGACGSLDNLKTARANGQSHWPWLVAVGFFDETRNFEVTCGGAIITKKHVITAAHCLTVRPNPTHVRVGDFDLGRNNDLAKPQDIRIGNFQTPGYKSDTFANDIAIITLALDVTFNDFIQPLCLPHRFRYDGFRYQNLNVIGWTHTRFSKGRSDQPQIPSDFLSPVIGLGDCQRNYQKTSKTVVIDRTNLCAVGGMQDVCLRDSSALAVYHDDVTTNRMYLAGLGSFGFGCDKPQTPYVFTRIGHHIPWIQSIISEGTFRN